MELSAGSRRYSAISEVEVVVVKAPNGGVGRLCCGGAAMVPPDGIRTAAFVDGEALLGKRYVSEAQGLELLCTKSGAGALSLDEVPLELKGAKPLPSSD